MARPASSRRFWVTVVPNRATGSSPSTGRCVTTEAPLIGNRRRTISWMYSRSPSEATTRASAGAWRSGRNTRANTTRPSTAASTRATIRALARVGRASRWTRLGQADERQDQVAGLAELEEGERHVHAHGRVGEVDHPGRAVRQHQAERERGDDRAAAQAGEEVAEVGADGGSPLGVGGSAARQRLADVGSAGVDRADVDPVAHLGELAVLITARICWGEHMAGRPGYCLPSQV